VSSAAFCLLVADNIHPLDLLSAIDTWNANIGAYSLMLNDLLPNALCLATLEGLTFHRLEVAVRIMICNFQVVEHLITSHRVISTFELHLLELLLNIFLDREELRLFTLHRTHACLVVELLQALVMESVLA
jgi:hypothetical protein